MKSLRNIIIAAVILLSSSLKAQVYQDQLEEIYLINEVSSSNDFESLNHEINNMEDFRFKTALKEAKKIDAVLEFSDEDTTLIVLKENYLRKIRKTANRSENSAEFISKLILEFPELKATIEGESSYVNLYHAVKADTFTGRLDQLPEVL